MGNLQNFSKETFCILLVVNFDIPHCGDMTDGCTPLFSLTSLYVICVLCCAMVLLTILIL